MVILHVTHINWKRMLARSSALEASDRSIAVSMVGSYLFLDSGGPDSGWMGALAK